MSWWWLLLIPFILVFLLLVYAFWLCHTLLDEISFDFDYIDPKLEIEARFIGTILRVKIIDYKELQYPRSLYWTYGETQ